jgi:hypothetical protein
MAAQEYPFKRQNFYDRRDVTAALAPDLWPLFELTRLEVASPSVAAAVSVLAWDGMGWIHAHLTAEPS